MPFPTFVIPAITSLAGALMGRKQSQTQSTSPTIDPAYGGLQSILLRQIQDRIAGGSQLPASYMPMRTAEINSTYENVGRGLNNNLTTRGLSASPMAGHAVANLDIARAGDIARMKQSLPLIQRDWQNQDLGLAENLLQMGRGATTTSTYTPPGGILGGGTSSLASMLAFMYGMQSPGGGVPDWASNPMIS